MIDYWAALVGVPGSGKTTRAKERASALAAAGRWVWVHDLGAVDYASWCPSYPHPRAWLDQSREGLPMPKVARFTSCSADDVLLAVVSLNKHRTDSGQPTLPLAVVIDEGCLIGGERRYSPTPAMMELLGRRRHLDCAVVFNVQYPTQVYFGFLSTATELDVFHQSDEENVKALFRHGLPKKLPPRGVCHDPPCTHFHFVQHLGRGQYLKIRRNPFSRV